MTSDHGDAAAKALNRAVGGGKRRSKSRGKPARTSSDSRDPLALADAMGELISNRGWNQDRAGAQVTALWPEIVGADLASHVQPESFVDGVLTLRAESTTWATQVRYLLPTLRTTIDAAVGSGVVTDIRIQGPQGPSWKAGPRHVKGRGPRDTYG
ncbi:MAG: DciA family protein [Actinomycetota bacterium]|nr:DciA family protein [Actinomycetota bacterium]